MWLDRLSGNSTPGSTPIASLASPANSRSFSPAPVGPRKSSHLAPTSAAPRSAFNPRSSSLSAHSNESTTSLLASSRKINGSSLKQSLAVTDAPDPLELLQKLLASLAIEVPAGLGNFGLDESVYDLDLQGMSLREIAWGISVHAGDEDEYTAPRNEEYDHDRARLEDLHDSIRACDDVLNSVELNLTSFQNDLATVSAEIETLQARSMALNVRLDNRKAVETALGPIVEEISIAPSVVRKLVDGAIDEIWVKALAEVEKRFKALESKANDRRNIKGISDLKPLLENLVKMALERIRDFLVAQIKALRSPNINAQIIQQQRFIRYKDLFAFLHKHHPQLSEEIGQAYINTMRWYFLNQFTRYEKALEKIKVHLIDRYDVLGQDDGTRRSTIMSGSKSTGPPHDAFNIGRRIDLLKTPNHTALSSFLAEEDRTTHYLEYPFRNFNLALIDNASAEYSFLTTFFSPSLPLVTITRQFHHIFEPTFALGQAFTKSLVSETYDCLGLLMCVRLNQHFAFNLQRRKVPAMDTYINGTSMLLWPRFQLVMDAHCESVRSVTAALPIRKALASEVAKQSAAPHFMTQRFGQFLQGILILSAEAGDDEPVATSLGRLRGEMESFLTKLGRAMEKRKRERFLYNNYSLILTIVGEVEGKLAVEQRTHFEAAKQAFEDAAL